MTEMKLDYNDLLRKLTVDVMKFLDGRNRRRMRVTLDAGAYEPVRAHPTDAGLDIRTPDEVMLGGMGSVVIRTGVHVELPPYTVGLLKSKSGLNVHHNIVGEGVIDQGYGGEIVVKLYNHGTRTHVFRKGDKIIQLLVLPCMYPNVDVVDEIESGERGSDGFGSTGK